jgi:hypothetical protein
MKIVYVNLILCIFLLLTSLGQEEQKPIIPNDLLEDDHVREELGVNEFTAPSIAKVFETLKKISPIPIEESKRNRPERMPLDRADLAIEIGFLIADGFVIVQSNDLKQVEPLAAELSRYGKALGAGDRVSRHMTSLIESAKKNDVGKLKNELALTQKDVEQELVSLRDTDLAHLISLGGWLRALNISAAVIQKEFTIERAKEIMREDIADYYTESLGTLHPRISERTNFVQIRELLSALRISMVIDDKNPLTPEKITEIFDKSKKLIELASLRQEQ